MVGHHHTGTLFGDASQVRFGYFVTRPHGVQDGIRAVHLGHVAQRVLDDLIQRAHAKHAADRREGHGGHPAADWISKRIRELQLTIRFFFGHATIILQQVLFGQEGWCPRASRNTLVGRNQGGVLRGADCSKSMMSLHTESQTA